MKFDCDQSNPTNGALFWLFRTKGNKYSQFVNVSASSATDLQPEYNAVNFSNNNYWFAKAENEVEYLTIHLPFQTLKITGYTLQTSVHSESSGYHPHKWAFAVSNDGVTYIHNETYTDEEYKLRGPLNKLHISYSQGTYSYFRLYPIEHTKAAKNQMDVNKIELFGELYSSKLIHTCAHFIPFSSPLFSLFIPFFLTNH